MASAVKVVNADGIEFVDEAGEVMYETSKLVRSISMLLNTHNVSEHQHNANLHILIAAHGCSTTTKNSFLVHFYFYSETEICFTIN